MPIILFLSNFKAFGSVVEELLAKDVLTFSIELYMSCKMSCYASLSNFKAFVSVVEELLAKDI